MTGNEHDRLIDVGLWTLSAIEVCTVVIFSVGPHPPLPSFTWADRVAHALAYCVLTVTLLLAAVWRPRRGIGRFPTAAALIVGAVMLLGILLEGAQSLTEGRSPSLLDAIANAAGVGAAAAGWGVLRRRSGRIWRS